MAPKKFLVMILCVSEDTVEKRNIDIVLYFFVWTIVTWIDAPASLRSSRDNISSSSLSGLGGNPVDNKTNPGSTMRPDEIYDANMLPGERESNDRVILEPLGNRNWIATDEQPDASCNAGKVSPIAAGTLPRAVMALSPRV